MSRFITLGGRGPSKKIRLQSFMSVLGLTPARSHRREGKKKSFKRQGNCFKKRNLRRPEQQRRGQRQGPWLKSRGELDMGGGDPPRGEGPEQDGCKYWWIAGESCVQGKKWTGPQPTKRD